MATYYVPDTNSFTLKEVCDIVQPSLHSLRGCFLQTGTTLFDSTHVVGFDVRYEGNHDRLSNFRNYSISGFSDWFLGSKDENNEMYIQLHLHGLGEFTNTSYWSSSEYNATLAEAHNFATGAQTQNTKSSGSHVRACRAFTSLTSYSLRDIGPAGGLIFWKSGNDYLEAAPVNTYGDTPWSNVVDIVIGTTDIAIGTGQANTTAIISQVSHTDSAAAKCLELLISI